MGKWLKIAFLVALLLGAGYFFGIVCEQIGQAYELMLSPSKRLPMLLLWFVLALGTMAVTGGLVAALVRPVWLGITAFALSGLTMLLGWQLTARSSVLALVYLLAASLYAVGVARELNQRIRFSVQPINTGQGMLLTALVLVACGSLYFGYAAHIGRESLSVPEPFVELLVAQLEKQFVASVSEEELQAPDFETKLATWREGARRNAKESLERMVKPYEQLIPLGVAASLFMFLTTITRLLAWMPALVLRVVFRLLKALGVAEEVSETREVQRLVIG